MYSYDYVEEQSKSAESDGGNAGNPRRMPFPQYMNIHPQPVTWNVEKGLSVRIPKYGKVVTVRGALGSV
jgi:hypothetical protein